MRGKPALTPALSIDGIGQATIAKILNREKIPTWGKNTGWHLAYVHTLLRSRTVLGEYQPRRRITRGKGVRSTQET